jgi:hypothetical protein
VSHIDDTVPVELVGPGVLAMDGERDTVLREGERVTVTVRRDGPWVIDPEKTMRAATEALRFVSRREG